MIHRVTRPAFVFFIMMGVGFIAISSSKAMPIEGCGPNTQCGSCHTLGLDEANTILKDVGQVKEVKHSTVRGLFELTMENQGRRAIAYMDYGKKHLIPAPIFNIASRKPVTGFPAQDKQAARVDIEKLPTAGSIAMGNPQGKKRLFVFTDPECPYCIKLHSELKGLIAMEPELAVHIKLFPLKMHPNAFAKSRVILAAKNPLEMLEKAFNGDNLPAVTENEPSRPVEDAIRLGGALGIESTPSMILPDGRIVVGFRSAVELSRMLAGSRE